MKIVSQELLIKVNQLMVMLTLDFDYHIFVPKFYDKMMEYCEATNQSTKYFSETVLNNELNHSEYSRNLLMSFGENIKSQFNKCSKMFNEENKNNNKQQFISHIEVIVPKKDEYIKPKCIERNKTKKYYFENGVFQRHSSADDTREKKKCRLKMVIETPNNDELWSNPQKMYYCTYCSP